MIRAWSEILRTGNLPSGKPLDPVSRWLLITRSFSFYQSLVSTAIGGLLAALDGILHPLIWIVTVVGVLIAHAASNMFNDLFDTLQGIDTEDYPRLQYAPHPLYHGLVSQTGLVVALLVCAVGCSLVGAWLLRRCDWGVAGFGAAGFLAAVAAVAPPFRFKQRGLGELLALVTWGPILTVGTYYVMAGRIPGRIWLASLPYGVAVAAGLMAKYLDKRTKDRIRWVLTLPVLLGERRARLLTQWLVWTFYLLAVGLVASGVLPWPVLLVLLSLPQAGRLLAILHAPLPETAQEVFDRGAGVLPEHIRKRIDPAKPLGDSPVWPFWYSAWGDRWKRLAGVLLVLGLLGGLLWEWSVDLW
jgi:1,4-dihydroxy-2-naphthoate polyprenyltransferase